MAYPPALAPEGLVSLTMPVRTESYLWTTNFLLSSGGILHRDISCKSCRRKAILFTHQHIIKDSSPRLQFATTMNISVMKVAAKVTESAKTELSQDSNVLVVHPFDVDENGKPFRAMERLLRAAGLRPQNKYETTWKRIARAVRDHVDGS
jgi:serine/threonine-protein kinase HipA